MIIILNKPHSFVDLITNSSTELFIIDKSNTEDQFKIFIDILMDMYEIDYESDICKLTDYPYKDEIEIPESYNIDDLYILNISYHNTLLNELAKRFHVVHSIPE